MIHFLHIGKTGGTAIKHALRDTAEPSGIICHDHSVDLSDIPVGESVVFFLRDPLSRFYSGFYSRLRKGAPRYNSEWSEDERLAFSNFTRPEEILNFAVSGNKMNFDAAIHALTTIEHVRNQFSDWIVSLEYLEKRSKDILHIGFQDTLEKDFSILKAKLKVNADIILPTSTLDAHVNPAYERVTLDSSEQAFFDGWYCEDINIYKYCVRKWRDPSVMETKF